VLLEKDFGPAIRSGFETTGLYPFSVEKAIAKLPVELEQREVDSDVQRTLLKTLEAMRHNVPPTKAAPRPKKADKLPAGAAYTCAAPDADEEDNSETSSDEDEDEDEERRERIRRVVQRLEDGEEEDSDDDDNDDDDDDMLVVDENVEVEPVEVEVDENVEVEVEPEVMYRPEDFVAAVYQDKWYIGQVLDKAGEAEAEGDAYVILNFMEQRRENNCFRWPEKRDVLNTLKDDVLFILSQPPLMSTNTSSTRSTCMLAWKDFDKAKAQFANYQAYYPTKILLSESCVVFSWVFFRQVLVLVL